MTKHICLFGSPAVGKSTVQCGLFYEMKRMNYSVHLLTEYQKDCIYQNNIKPIEDQLMVLQNQRHPWTYIETDYTVNDGPFLLSQVYVKENGLIPTKEFNDLVVSLYKKHDTINFFLEKDFDGYETQGRRENETESNIINQKILNVLIQNDIPFKKVKTSDAIQTILKELETP